MTLSTIETRLRALLLAHWQTPVGLTAREGARNTALTVVALAALAVFAVWLGIRWMRRHAPS